VVKPSCESAESRRPTDTGQAGSAEPAEVGVAQARSFTSGIGSGGTAGAAPQFYSVAQVAEMFGMSTMTVYRAIAAGEFPAVRIRGRLIVPAKALDAMVDAALDHGVADASASMPEGA
jgi:excisionase family DNA binding protein